MSNNNTANSAPNVGAPITASTGLSIRAQIAKLEALFPPELDHDLWLKHNAPLTFQELGVSPFIRVGRSRGETGRFIFAALLLAAPPALPSLGLRST